MYDLLYMWIRTMICGIGCDIVEVKRFKHWIGNPSMIDRFFNDAEKVKEVRAEQSAIEWYAVRFAAKEAFSKALGTGIKGFNLADIVIRKTDEGQPVIEVKDKAKKLLEDRFGTECAVHVTLSHEKEYAVAFVVIERG
jgi:holo-[acyl-carrier protein] synthase